MTPRTRTYSTLSASGKFGEMEENFLLLRETTISRHLLWLRQTTKMKMKKKMMKKKLNKKKNKNKTPKEEVKV